MDSSTEISSSSVITGIDSWRVPVSSLVHSVPFLTTPAGERPSTAGSRLVELYASCLQGAHSSVRTGFGADLAIAKQQHSVMGGFNADDFGTRWGSKPGSPPE